MSINNSALLFTEQSELPFYYRQLPENISDTKTLERLLGYIEDAVHHGMGL